MKIMGQVQDRTGSGIAGATVTAAETPCSSISAADGHYSLSCETGQHRLVISKPGHLTAEVHVGADEKQDYTAPTARLLRIPESPGLYWLTEEGYASLKPTHLVENVSGKGRKKKRAYCLDSEQSERNRSSSLSLSFLDREAAGWRLVRLDAEGCAYRDSRNQRGSWVADYLDKPKLQTQKISAQVQLKEAELPAGEYFVADWRGFFVATEAPGEKHFGGAWITVEARPAPSN
jgi:hypothetical protein